MVNSEKNHEEQLKNIIFLGTLNAKYHPMDGIDTRLCELLPEMNVEASDNTGVLNPMHLKDCAVFVLYREFDLPPLTDSETASLLTYVAEGGSLLVLHNGISVQSRSELSQLIGAEFTGHPSYEELPPITYCVEKPAHPLFKGVSDFTMFDEAYQFKIDPFAGMELLLSYEFQDTRLPAGWIRSYGRGRVVYLCCGHNKECFYNKEFSRILQNSAAWLSEREDKKE